jgi:hypothetical protein
LIRGLQLLLAVALACAGAWAAVHGAQRAGRAGSIASPSLVGTLLIGPLLLVPMLGIGVDLTARGQSHAAHASLTAVVLLNLCLLLPVMVVEAHLHPLQKMIAMVDARGANPPSLLMNPSPATRPATLATTRSATRPTTHPTTRATTRATTAPADLSDDSPELFPAPALPFPPALWRVDTVILIVLAMFLLPVSVGRWALARGAGIALVLGYLAYLAVALIVGATTF